MGESKKEVLPVQFDPIVKLEFQGPKIISDGGLLLFREMDEGLGLTVFSRKSSSGSAHGPKFLVHEVTYGN